jgi:hypothetical protein
MADEFHAVLRSKDLTPAVVRSGRIHRAECSCGYVSRYVATERAALADGIQHARKSHSDTPLRGYFLGRLQAA